MCVGGQLLPVVANRPEVDALWCANAPMVGHALAPTASLRPGTGEGAVAWTWTRRAPGAAAQAAGFKEPRGQGTEECEVEVVVGDKREYTPTTGDVGGLLTVYAQPPPPPGCSRRTAAPAAAFVLTAPVKYEAH